MMALWFFGFLLLGLLLLWLAQRGRTRSGLPRGRVVYSDTGAWGRVDRPLFSHEFQLTGKPDYVVADGSDIIPVEVKSGSGPVQPYDAHVLQLAAYCLLVEECYGRDAPYGIIKYDDHTFEVDYTFELEQRLLGVLEDMRRDLYEGDAPRDHDDARRCRACGYREHCDESLV
jgi:CRISPR-associated exonuclease Cas4